MACAAQTSCGTCTATGYCGFCLNACSNANSSSFPGCEWEEVLFLGKECPEASKLGIAIGIAAALVVLFFVWIGYRGYTSKLRRGLKASTGMEELYAKSNVVDVDFKDINLEAFKVDPNLNAMCIGKQIFWHKLAYYIGWISSLYYVWGLLSDALAFRSMYITGRQTEAVFYAATVVISLGLIAYDIYQANRILHHDDVSDGFLNADVVRYRSFRLSNFTFFKFLKDGVKCADKLALFLYVGLIGAPRLAFVEVPQLVLVIVARIKLSDSLSDRCGIIYSDSLCFFSACSKCVSDHGPDGLSVAGLIFKGVFLGLALYKFFIAACLFPWVRCIISLRFAKFGGKDFTLTGYCSYLIDIRICELLAKTPGAVPDDFWEKRGMTTDGKKKTLKEHASEIKQAAVEKVQETKTAAVEKVQGTKTAAVEKVADTKAAVKGQVTQTVDRAIDIRDNAQDKYQQGKSRVQGVFSAGKGALSGLRQKEGSSSPTAASAPSSPTAADSPSHADSAAAAAAESPEEPPVDDSPSSPA